MRDTVWAKTWHWSLSQSDFLVFELKENLVPVFTESFIRYQTLITRWFFAHSRMIETIAWSGVIWSLKEKSKVSNTDYFPEKSSERESEQKRPQSVCLSNVRSRTLARRTLTHETTLYPERGREDWRLKKKIRRCNWKVEDEQEMTLSIVVLLSCRFRKTTTRWSSSRQEHRQGLLRRHLTVLCCLSVENHRLTRRQTHLKVDITSVECVSSA